MLNASKTLQCCVAAALHFVESLPLTTPQLALAAAPVLLLIVGMSLLLTAPWRRRRRRERSRRAESDGLVERFNDWRTRRWNRRTKESASRELEAVIHEISVHVPGPEISPETAVRNIMARALVGPASAGRALALPAPRGARPTIPRPRPPSRFRPPRAAVPPPVPKVVRESAAPRKTRVFRRDFRKQPSQAITAMHPRPRLARGSHSAPQPLTAVTVVEPSRDKHEQRTRVAPWSNLVTEKVETSQLLEALSQYWKGRGRA
jgi:hypothetical protein